MTQSELSDHIGEYVNIVNGKYMLHLKGDFLISTEIGTERVWLVDGAKPQCITTKPYIGRRYELGSVDCITLVCEYLKSEELMKFYRGMSRERLWKLQRLTVMKWLDEDDRFIDVGQDFEVGDCVIYSYTERMRGNHMGIVLPDNKILHHLPVKSILN